MTETMLDYGLLLKHRSARINKKNQKMVHSRVV